MAAQHKSKNQLRRERQKLKKQEPRTEEEEPKALRASPPTSQHRPLTLTVLSNATEGTSGKLFESELDQLLDTPEFSQFKKVFDRFHTEEAVDEEDELTNRGEIMDSDDGETMDQDVSIVENEQPTMSKKKLRKTNKIPLSELKSYTKFPELVEWFDADAAHPKLVIQLKSLKNAVPVPKSWQFKRDYLAGKRGFEKKPFELPKFIRDTGITDMRDTTKDDESSMKQRQREKVQPKLNRLDMDYKKLHDAFFKFQTKPPLYGFGDLFYEGREMEDETLKRFRPGVVSEELRQALGVAKGMGMPWIGKMQMYGPPPSYPHMKIPGFNAPVDSEGVVDRPVGSVDDVVADQFGKVLSYEESESEEEVDDEDEGEDEEEEKGVGYIESDDEQAVVVDTEKPVDENEGEDEDNEDEYKDYHEPTDVPLSSIDTSSIDMSSRVVDTPEIEPRKLYQILKERVQSQDGLMSSNRSYDLGEKRLSDLSDKDGSKRQKANDDGVSTQRPSKSTQSEDEDEEVDAKFKF